MYDPSLTAKEMYRGMVKKTCEVPGYDRYMLSCCGVRDSDILRACDMFDAARVGGDIFKWEDFLKEGIGPMDISRAKTGDNVTVVLNVARDGDDYSVVGVMNTSDEAKSAVSVNLGEFGITDGEIIVREYFEGRLYTAESGALSFDSRPHETKIFAVRKRLCRPQLIGTTRHFTQGAVEISGMKWDENALTLSFDAETVKGDDWDAVINVPNGYIPLSGAVSSDGAMICRVPSQAIGKHHFEFRFSKA